MPNLSEVALLVNNPSCLAVVILVFVYFTNNRLRELINKVDNLQNKVEKQFKFCLRFFPQQSNTKG